MSHDKRHLLPIKRPGRGHCGVGVYISPECFLPKCPTLGLIFQVHHSSSSTLKSAESRKTCKISDQEFRKTKNLVLGYKEN